MKAAAEAEGAVAQLREAAAAREQLADDVAKLTKDAARAQREHAEELDSARAATREAEDALKTLRERAQVDTIPGISSVLDALFRCQACSCMW